MPTERMTDERLEAIRRICAGPFADDLLAEVDRLRQKYEPPRYGAIIGGGRRDRHTNTFHVALAVWLRYGPLWAERYRPGRVELIDRELLRWPNGAYRWYDVASPPDCIAACGNYYVTEEDARADLSETLLAWAKAQAPS